MHTECKTNDQITTLLHTLLPDCTPASLYTSVTELVIQTGTAAVMIKCMKLEIMETRGA